LVLIVVDKSIVQQHGLESLALNRNRYTLKQECRLILSHQQKHHKIDDPTWPERWTHWRRQWSSLWPAG